MLYPLSYEGGDLYKRVYSGGTCGPDIDMFWTGWRSTREGLLAAASVAGGVFGVRGCVGGRGSRGGGRLGCWGMACGGPFICLGRPALPGCGVGFVGLEVGQQFGLARQHSGQNRPCYPQQFGHLWVGQ